MFNELSAFLSLLVLAFPVLQLLFTNLEPSRRVCSGLPRHMKRIANVG